MIPLPVDPTVVVLLDDKGGVHAVKSNISPELSVVITRNAGDFENAASGRPYTPQSVRETSS
jgi:hypothetical protein